MAAAESQPFFLVIGVRRSETSLERACEGVKSAAHQAVEADPGLQILWRRSNPVNLMYHFRNVTTRELPAAQTRKTSIRNYSHPPESD